MGKVSQKRKLPGLCKGNGLLRDIKRMLFDFPKGKVRPKEVFI